MHALPTRARRARTATRRGLAGLAVTAVLLSGCSAAKDATDDAMSKAGIGDDTPSAGDSTTAAAAVEPVIKTNVRKGAQGVPVDTRLEVTAEDATLTKVTVTQTGAQLPGTLAKDGSRWTADDGLEPGVTYRVKSTGRSTDGTTVHTTSSFTTEALSLDQQTYPSVAPLDGETVGIGMPVIVTFDVPVTDRKTIERHLHVKTTPAQQGTWHWLNGNEVHYRPKTYWKAGTDVSVDVDINGVPAGGGIYGQEDRLVDFHVGDAHVYKVDAQTDQMKVYSNGQLLRTLPITTGKPGFTTRSGVKVIIEKFDVKRMNSETVGIPAGSSEAYDIDDVQWAMRVTYSGEFIHAAPWSVGSQGYENVSHGCTGMSTDNAAWLYAMSRRGDVVEYTGTDRPMEPDNGYGDWNIPWSEYKTGSAL